MRYYFSTVLIVIYSLMSSSWADESGGRVAVVEVVVAEYADITRTVRLLGTLKAKRSMLLTAKATGILDYIQIQGQQLKKDELIAQLDNIDLYSNYQIAVQTESVAKNQYERTLRLFEQGLEAAEKMDDQQKHWLDTRTRLADAKIKLDQSRFIAPFDGVVGTYKIHEGAQVQVGDAIVYFYDPSDLIVTFDIPAPLLTQIHPDQEVVIHGQTLKLPYIQRMVDPATHMSPTYVGVNCDTCIVGTHVDVDLILQKYENVFVVPTEAVFLKDSKPHVYIVKEDMVELIPVTIGVTEKDRVEIVSGLNPGDLVVATGQHRLYEGDKVRIHDN